MTKAAWVCLDIEAYRTTNQTVIEQITRQAWEARPFSNTLKEEKALWDTPDGKSKRIAAAIAKTAVNPILAEPLVICTSVEGGEVMTFDMMESVRRDVWYELALLIEQNFDRETTWVGHNIEGYDLSILLVQFQKLGITPPNALPTYRRSRWRGNIWDTMGATPSQTPFTSMLDACVAYGITAKSIHWKNEPMTGSRVGEAYEAGEYQLIRDYCAQDVRDETALFMAQTCGGTWGVGSRIDATAEQLTEIAESTLTPAQKWLASVPVLQSYGLLK